VWQSNPLFDALYQNASPPLRQVWDSYRITTSLGHPLVNGMFFAGGGAIALGRLVQNRRSFVHLLPAAASILGVVLTSSRGSIAAIAIALAVIVLAAGSRRSMSRPALAAIVVALGAVAVVALSSLGSSLPLLERFGSVEAANSAAVRSLVITQGLELSLPKLAAGWGPGTADAVFNSFVSGGSLHSLEDGWIEILVDTGIGGFVLIVALVLSCVLFAFRRGNVEGAGLLAAMAVAIAGFSFFDGQWPAMIMLGAALGIALTDRTDEQFRLGSVKHA
jgi:O-antigen ligase